MCHHVVAVTHDERIGHVVRLVTDESGHSMGTNIAASHCHSIIADFCLKLMPGDLTRYVFYFWYPIGDSLTLVFIQQVVPFIGYCLLMGIANIAVFNCRDRLRMS